MAKEAHARHELVIHLYLIHLESPRLMLNSPTACKRCCHFFWVVVTIAVLLSMINSIGLRTRIPDTNCDITYGRYPPVSWGGSNRLTSHHMELSSSISMPTIPASTSTLSPTLTPIPTPISPAPHLHPPPCNPNDSQDFPRAYSASLIDHLYTSSYSEMLNAVSSGGYSYEGRAFGVFGSQQPSTVPLYRLYHPDTTDHFYTASVSEQQIAVANNGYLIEGIAAYVYPSQICGSVPLYRLYLPIGDHFYTTSAPERENAIALGYTYQGIAAYVLP